MPRPNDTNSIILPADYAFGQKFNVALPGIWEGVTEPLLERGHLSVGLPSPSFLSENSAANQHWFWFPEGIPPGKSLCLASSRLGQKFDQYDQWFDALRTLASRLDPATFFWVTAAGTTTDVFVRRVADLFGFVVVEFVAAPTDNWSNFPGSQPGSLSSNQRVPESPIQTCFYRRRNQPDDSTLEWSPDEILIGSAREVRLLSVRHNGNVHAATQQRLNHSSIGDTKLLIDKQLTRKSVLNELIGAGAVGWWLYDSIEPKPVVENPITKSGSVDLESNVRIIELSEFAADAFLIHWTRRRRGPWPDQTESEYVDDLIFQTHRRRHGEMDALSRLLATGRIIASNDLTRDQRPVVCFSNLPLTDIGARKIFRQHLGRWDFLPYGIALNRQLLFDLGARPVIYGNEADWKNLSSEQRPFFQLANSKNGKLDWTVEQEWRLPGNLDLNQFPLNAVVVFVESPPEAELIAALSRWPIVVVGKSENVVG